MPCSGGQFLLTSGWHSDQYFQCALVLQYPEYTEMLCRELVARLSGEGIATVVGPAMGGIIMSYEVAKGPGAPGASVHGKGKTV